MKYCGIISCKNNQGVRDQNVCVFRASRCSEIAKKWLNALDNLGLPVSSSVPSISICSLHFHPDDLKLNCKRKTLKPDALPSIKPEPPEPVDEIESVEVSNHDDEKDDTSHVGNNITVKKEPPNYDRMASSVHCQTQSNNSNSPTIESEIDSCGQCIKYRNRVYLLTIDTENIKQKYLAAQKEYSKLKGKLHSVDHRNRKSKMRCNQRCEVCFERVADLNQHICLDQLEVKCEYCSAIFESTLDLGFHLSDVKHPEMKLFKCSECSVGFSAAILLKFHQLSYLTHKSTNLSSSDKLLYECYICKEKFRNMRNMKCHIKLHVAARDKKCDVCNESLTSNELDLHLCGSEKSIECEYCHRSFNVTTELLQHLENDHKTVLYGCRSKLTSRNCSRFFGMTLLREIHEKQHENETIFSCQTCGKGFAKRFLLKTHEKLHSELQRKYYLCSECGKTLQSASSFRLHRLSHNEKTIQCPDCPATFNTQFYLRRHQETHLEKKYKCNELNCNYECSTRRAFLSHSAGVHQKTKTKLRKFECPSCPWKFPTKATFETHMRTHSGDKPFTCEFCAKRYAHKGDLTKHLQTHLGNNIYNCDECGKGFRLLVDLRKHSYEHYKEKKAQSQTS